MANYCGVLVAAYIFFLKVFLTLPDLSQLIVVVRRRDLQQSVAADGRNNAELSQVGALRIGKARCAGALGSAEPDAAS
jgi:hypothetical protein